MTRDAKRLFIKTFGCQMNVYDSERMNEALGEAGYVATDTPDEADLVILNTCHIREKAAEKVYSEIGRLKQIKTARAGDGRATTIAVAGCVAQAEGREMLARAPAVDLVVGPQSYHRLGELVGKARDGERLIDVDFPDDDKFHHLPARPARAQAPSAFLTVQEGCDKFCTFCVVPYTRGIEYSRPVADVVAEAERLAQSGVAELTLLGQNVNAYHGEGPDGSDWSLARLLYRLADIPSIRRLRYTTSHPRDMSEDLIRAHGDLDTLMPYLHLPFQAGADRILFAMNRKHTRADYIDLVARIRDARPDIALSTDIIVGFPGETDAEFEQTIDLVEEIRFAQAYSFKYSARPGTPAETMDDQVPEAVKSDRLQRLQDLLASQQKSFNAACVGKRFQVLFERAGRKDGQIVGRSPYLQAVHAEGSDALIGTMMKVEISAAGPNSLEADILEVSNRVSPDAIAMPMAGE